MASGENLKNMILLYRNLEHQYQISGYTNKELKTIQKALTKARDDLFWELGQMDIRLPEGREHAVLEELNNLTFGIQAQLTGSIQEAAYMAGVMSIREYGDILSFNGQISETVGFNFATVSPDQLRAMVNAPVGGKLMNEWVAESFHAHIVDGIQTAIMAGELVGRDSKIISEGLQDAFGMIQKDADTLVRTQIADVNNRAAEMVYKANSDIIKAEVWRSTLEVGPSGRSTCLACAVLDGRSYKLDEPHIRPPKHLRCRCFMVPETLSYRDLGLDIDEMEKSLRAFSERDENREILKAGQYAGGFKSFLKSKSKKYHKELLGPNRYRMLEAGEIKWDDLVDKNGEIVLLKKGKDGAGYTGLKQ